MKKGLTIVELLIAITLCGIVAFIVIEMMRGESDNYTKTRNKIKLQSEAREAVRIIEEELKNTGFRMSAKVVAGVLSPSDCGNAYTGINSFFKPISNGIEFRVYNPFSDANFNCADAIQTISYTLNPTDSTLYRQWAKGISADMSTVEKVPFLQHVAKFTFDYGIYRDNDPLLEPVAASTNAVVATNVAVTRVTTTADRPWSITGWNTDPSCKAVLQLNLGKLDTNATYRISFQAYASKSFLDTVKGVHLPSLKAGFATSSGTATENVFTFKPGLSSGAGGARTIQYDLVPSKNGIEDDVYFAIYGKMKGAAVNPELGISNIKITKLNHGTITWVEQNATPTPDWSKVAQIRLNLLTFGRKKEPITLQRIITVVNNDPRN